MLSAIGMSFVLGNYAQVAQGARVKPVPPIITGGYTLLEKNGFVVRLSNEQIVVVITTVVLLAIFTWLLARTRLAADTRACAQDQATARPRQARLRAGPEDGGAARGRRRPHHLDDVRDRGRAGGGGGHDVPAI